MAHDEILSHLTAEQVEAILQMVLDGREREAKALILHALNERLQGGVPSEPLDRRAHRPNEFKEPHRG